MEIFAFLESKNHENQDFRISVNFRTKYEVFEGQEWFHCVRSAILINLGVGISKNR